MVCEDHIIQPNALLGSSGKLKSKNAITIASGNEPIPPFVAAILKLAKINPINTGAKDIPSKSDKDKVVT